MCTMRSSDYTEYSLTIFLWRTVDQSQPVHSIIHHTQALCFVWIFSCSTCFPLQFRCYSLGTAKWNDIYRAHPPLPESVRQWMGGENMRDTINTDMFSPSSSSHLTSTNEEVSLSQALLFLHPSYVHMGIASYITHTLEFHRMLPLPCTKVV